MRVKVQHTQSDCGPACLAYVAEQYKMRVSVATLRHFAGTTTQGTTALGLIEAARALGFSARGIRIEGGDLAEVPKYSIAHVRLPDGRGHFVVFIGCHKNVIRVMDPAGGIIVEHTPESFRSLWAGVMILLVPDSSPKRSLQRASVSSRLWTILAAHKYLLIQLLAGAVATAILGLVMSFFMQKVIDYVIPDSNVRLLVAMGMAMICFILFRLGIGYLQFVYSVKLAQRLDIALILGYYRHLLFLPQRFYDSMKIGEMTSRIGDALQIRSFLSTVIVSIVVNPLVIVVAGVAMFFFSWKLALFSFLQVPFQIGVYLYLNRVNKKYQRRIKELGADLSSYVVETMQSIRTLKHFDCEERAANGLEGHFVRLQRTRWQAGFAAFLGSSTAGALTQLFSLFTLWLGAVLVIKTEISAGELMSAYVMSNYLTSGLAGLVGLSSQLQQSLISAERLFEIMDIEKEDVGHSSQLQPDSLAAISVRNVRMKHPGRMPFIDNLSFEIRRGEITVITGDSGCGKSSLLAALQKIYPIDEGRITFGEIDIDNLTVGELRRAFSVLPQKIDLISGTIMDNIVLGATQLDLARAASLCHRLGLLEFINSLPNKMNTGLLEGGGGLSGGQRQKIALVRTFYRNTSVVILDEPTTGLDSGACGLLAKLLLELKAQGKTIIIASHHQSMIDLADNLVTLRVERFLSRTVAIDHPVQNAVAS